MYGNEGQKQDKFILTSQPEQLKCIVTLTGDSITHAVSIAKQFLNPFGFPSFIINISKL